MARIPGRLSRLQVSTDGGNTFIQVNGITDLTLNMNVAEIKVTAHDDNDFEAYIVGRKDISIDAKLRYDESDAGQDAVNAAAFSGASLAFKVTMQTLSGMRLYTGTSFPTKGAVAGPNDNEATYDVTLRVTGAMVQSTQP